jgi:hypothetical protein
MNKPGWYPDPENAGALRWWDGARWSLPVDIGSDPVIDLRAPHAVQAGRPDPLFGCAPLPIENAPVKVDLAPIESTLAAPTPMAPSFAAKATPTLPGTGTPGSAVVGASALFGNGDASEPVKYRVMFRSDPSELPSPRPMLAAEAPVVPAEEAPVALAAEAPVVVAEEAPVALAAEAPVVLAEEPPVVLAGEPPVLLPAEAQPQLPEEKASELVSPPLFGASNDRRLFPSPVSSPAIISQPSPDTSKTAREPLSLARLSGMIQRDGSSPAPTRVLLGAAAAVAVVAGIGVLMTGGDESPETVNVAMASEPSITSSTVVASSPRVTGGAQDLAATSSTASVVQEPPTAGVASETTAVPAPAPVPGPAILPAPLPSSGPPSTAPVMRSGTVAAPPKSPTTAQPSPSSPQVEPQPAAPAPPAGETPTVAPTTLAPPVYRPAPTIPDRVPTTTTPLACDPNYTGGCVPVTTEDVDCFGGGEDGPSFVVGPLQVVGIDIYLLDPDQDGTACEVA